MESPDAANPTAADPDHTDARPPVLGRRRALAILGSAGAAAVVGAVALASRSDSPSNVSSAGGSTPTAEAAAGTATPATVSSVAPIPSETGGPYPADGTNGPNVLTEPGVVRSDIRSSFGSASALADGVPLAIELTIVDTAGSTVMPGAAVYLWHCDREGRYSLYSQRVTGENFLRGVQVADSGGVLRFATTFPGAYSGRWPHIHFEVFESAAAATTGRNAMRTSQLALPQSTCETVYATAGYESSVRNLAQSSLSSDNVFRDGVDLQLATMSGSVAEGYTARLTVGI